MKKGQVYEGIIESVEFPNKGRIYVPEEDRWVVVKNGVPGQKVRFSVNKIRKGKAEGRLLEVVEPSVSEIPSACPHFGQCGGCTYQNLPYEEQLAMKNEQVKKMMDEAVNGEYIWEGIKPSPVRSEYRNKMEFSFGDEYKDGPLALGMHKRGSFHDIVNVTDCQIVDEDYRKILACTLECARESGLPYYHRMRHVGYFRHLLVRKAVKTGEILVDLVTASDTAELGIDPTEAVSKIQAFKTVWLEKMTSLKFDGTLVGILHTKNDSLADVVKDEGTEVLFGQDYFYEELLGLKFKITPFSFFQTNSLGAEVLYETAREYIGDTNEKVVFDLYSGTGTIAQILAPVAKKVVGVEIVEEAVEAANKDDVTQAEIDQKTEALKQAIGNLKKADGKDTGKDNNKNNDNKGNGQNVSNNNANGKNPKGGNHKNVGKNNKNNNGNAAKTGDTMPVIPIASAVAAFAVIAEIIRRRIKNR